MSTGSTYLGQYNINFAIRPERLGYLLRKGSAEEFGQAVREATSRWGGLTEPMITYGDDGSIAPALGLTLVHPVDNFTVVGDSSNEELTNLRRQISADILQFDQVGELGLHQLAVQPKPDPDDRRLILVTPSEPWPAPIYAAKDGDSIAAIAAAGLVDEQGWKVWQQFGYPLTAMEWPKNYRAQLNRRTVVHASAAQLKDLPGTEVGTLPGVVIVVTDGDLEDAIYFWNLRASVMLGVFDPIECVIVDQATFAQRQFLDEVEGRARDRFEHVTPAALVIGRQEFHEPLTKVVADIGWEVDRNPQFRVSMTRGAQETVSKPMTVRFVEQGLLSVRLRQVGATSRPLVQFERRRTVVDVASPAQFAAPFGRVRARFWGASPFELPPGTSQGKLFHDAAYVFGRAIEIATSASPRYDFTLRIPEPGELLSSSLADAGISWKLSDKGKMASGVAARFTDLAPLRDAKTLACIRALTTHRIEYDIKKLASHLPGVDQVDLARMAAQLVHVRQTFRSLAGIASEAGIEGPEAGPIIERLVQAGILDRGFKVNCPHCGMDYFLEMSDLRPDLTCPGCFSPVTPSTHRSRGDLDLQYRLNTLVDRAGDNGAIGHILLIDAFQRHDPRAFVLPGVDLTFEGKQREADAIALIGQDIWTGEVKGTSEGFTETQIQKDVEVAHAAKARHYVMAAMDDIPGEFIRLAIDAARSHAIYVWTYRGPDGTLVQRLVG
jgi:hypothetical protein